MELITIFENKISKQNQILDLGGGTGKLSNLINNNGSNSMCFDFSVYMHYFDKEKLLVSLKHIRFDIIYCNTKKEIGKNELGSMGNDKLLVLAKIRN